MQVGIDDLVGLGVRLGLEASDLIVLRWQCQHAASASGAQTHFIGDAVVQKAERCRWHIAILPL